MFLYDHVRSFVSLLQVRQGSFFLERFSHLPLETSGTYRHPGAWAHRYSTSLMHSFLLAVKGENKSRITQESFSHVKSVVENVTFMHVPLARTQPFLYSSGAGSVSLNCC